MSTVKPKRAATSRTTLPPAPKWPTAPFDKVEQTNTPATDWQAVGAAYRTALEKSLNSGTGDAAILMAFDTVIARCREATAAGSEPLELLSVLLHQGRAMSSLPGCEILFQIGAAAQRRGRNEITEKIAAFLDGVFTFQGAAPQSFRARAAHLQFLALRMLKPRAALAFARRAAKHYEAAEEIVPDQILDAIAPTPPTLQVRSRRSAGSPPVRSGWLRGVDAMRKHLVGIERGRGRARILTALEAGLIPSAKLDHRKPPAWEVQRDCLAAWSRNGAPTVA